MELGITPAGATVTAAVIAAFVGFMSLVIAKEQKVSEFRQTWINALRDDLAEAISSASTLTTMLQDAAGRLSEARLREWARFAAALARIELRMNRTEEPHKRLIACIREAENLMHRLDESGGDYDQKEWLSLQDQVVKVSQDLLKIEWDIVKAGEPFYKGVKVTLILALALTVLGSLISFACDGTKSRATSTPAVSVTSRPANGGQPL